MNNTTMYRTGDIVVCVYDEYDNIPWQTIGVVLNEDAGFALVNCSFDGVTGAFPCHHIMPLNTWLYYRDKEEV